MNIMLEVIRLNNEDVIATSSLCSYDNSYINWGTLYFTGQYYTSEDTYGGKPAGAGQIGEPKLTDINGELADIGVPFCLKGSSSPISSSNPAKAGYYHIAFDEGNSRYVLYTCSDPSHRIEFTD